MVKSSFLLPTCMAICLNLLMINRLSWVASSKASRIQIVLIERFGFGGFESSIIHLERFGFGGFESFIVHFERRFILNDLDSAVLFERFEWKS